MDQVYWFDNGVLDYIVNGSDINYFAEPPGNGSVNDEVIDLVFELVDQKHWEKIALTDFLTVGLAGMNSSQLVQSKRMR